MGGIIWLFIIGWIVIKIVKGNEALTKENVNRQKAGKLLQQQMANQQRADQRTQRTVTEEDRTRLESYRKKKGSNAYVPSKPVQTNQDLDKNRQRVRQEPDIVERAKANSKKHADVDETLEALESEHDHTERVSSAVADYVEEERKAHVKLHEEKSPRVEEESLLGSVEDLMVKGYDGSLSFERDFIGEASDFLTRLTL